MIDDGYTTSRGFVPIIPRKLVWMTPKVEKLRNGGIVSKATLASLAGFRTLKDGTPCRVRTSYLPMPPTNTMPWQRYPIRS